MQLRCFAVLAALAAISCAGADEKKDTRVTSNGGPHDWPQWRGPDRTDLSAETGCVKGGIMNWKDGITTRAVLYDIAQLKGVDTVDPAMPIRRADLEAWEKKAGVKIGPGDIPLLYIGRWKRRAAQGAINSPVAGYYPDTIPWMHDRLPSFITGGQPPQPPQHGQGNQGNNQGSQGGNGPHGQNGPNGYDGPADRFPLHRRRRRHRGGGPREQTADHQTMDHSVQGDDDGPPSGSPARSRRGR